MYPWQYLIEIDWKTKKYESEFHQKIFPYITNLKFLLDIATDTSIYFGQQYHTESKELTQKNLTFYCWLNII
jgi:hypothetical protein